MQSFIRVVEIWTPDDSGPQLKFHDGSYGALTDFEEVSRQTTFAYGEGLPGIAWKEACPIVFKDFDDSPFMRTQAAHEVDLTSGVAIPLFQGKNLKAVLVFLCGDRQQPAGAIEVWADDEHSGQSLLDGYYGDLDRFEWLSKRIKFPRGRGLPGMVWEKAAPHIADMSDSNAFLRAKAAAEEGINTGIGIPFNSDSNIDDIGTVVAFLSSKSTPIAKRFEIWKPSEDGETLYFESGVEQFHPAIETSDPDKTTKKGEGVIGEAWQTGIPCIATESDSDHASVLAIPVYYLDELSSVVAFYN